MSVSPKRVLLTGASGFTGRYMQTELLAHGYEVIGTGRRSDDGVDDDVRLVHVDLCDRDAVASLVAEVRPEIVIHLAALAFVGHGSANDFYNVNLIGTRNLLEMLAAMDDTPARVLLASSANVYGNASEGTLDESTPPAPANDYAVSKLAMEFAAGLWSERLPIVTTRPFNYTGVGQAENFLVSKIVAHYRRRETSIELGNLDVSRDFSDVRNVVGAYRRLIETPAAVGRTVNVCSGRAYSLREILELCAAITGHSLQVRVNPTFVRSNDVKVLRGANGVLRGLIGEWGYTPLSETLEWMLAAA